MNDSALTANRKPLTVLLIAVAALVPLAMNPLGADAFSLPKLTVLALACLLGLALFAWDAFENSAIHFRAPILWKAVGFWLLWCSLKTYFSTNPSGSFWGLYLFQFNGLLEMFLYAIVLWLAMMVSPSSFSSPPRGEGGLRGDLSEGEGGGWRWVDLALFSAAAIMCLYGIAQYFGMDPFPFKELGPGGRIWSTMGNPNFFGMFIAMVCPLLFVFLLKEERFVVKALGLILFTLLFVCLFLARARGAWIATAGGLLLTALFERGARSEERGVKKLIAVVLVCAALAFLLTNMMSRLSLTATPKTASVSISERAASTIQFKSSGVQGRLSMWRTGLRLFREKPIFGWGLDTAFSYNFRKFMEHQWESLTKPNAVPPYAHNEFLNVVCDLGLVGLGIYLWILFLFFRQAFSAGEFGPLGAVSALLIQNLFSFSTITGSLLFWMLLGRVYSREPLQAFRWFPPVLRVWLRQSALALLCLAALICAVFVTRPLRADRHFQRGRGLITLGRWPQAAIEMEKAMNLFPYAWWQRELLGKGYAEISQQKHLTPEERFRLLNLSANNWQTFIGGWPQSAFGYNGAGVTYVYAAELSGKHKAYFIPNAILQFEKAIELDPHFREAYSNLAQILFAQGKRREAFELIQKGIERNPEAASLHFMLGNFYGASGDMDSAIENWKRVIDLEPNHAEAQARLSEALLGNER